MRPIIWKSACARGLVARLSLFSPDLDMVSLSRLLTIGKTKRSYYFAFLCSLLGSSAVLAATNLIVAECHFSYQRQFLDSAWVLRLRSPRGKWEALIHR